MWCDPACLSAQRYDFLDQLLPSSRGRREARSQPSLHRPVESGERDPRIAAARSSTPPPTRNSPRWGASSRASTPRARSPTRRTSIPAAQADALGLHYPHEFPDFQVWPNAAWWMDQPIARDWVPGGQWTWDHSKPLYIGEFLWVPSTSAADFTILFGDDAYSDPAYYRNQAKGLTWKMQIEAYRAYGVNGMAPGRCSRTPASSGASLICTRTRTTSTRRRRRLMNPTAVFAEEYNTRFFAGDTVHTHGPPLQ